MSFVLSASRFIFAIVFYKLTTFRAAFLFRRFNESKYTNTRTHTYLERSRVTVLFMAFCRQICSHSSTCILSISTWGMHFNRHIFVTSYLIVSLTHFVCCWKTTTTTTVLQKLFLLLYGLRVWYTYREQIIER